MANLTVSGSWISLVRIRAISSSEMERPSKLNRDLVKGSGIGVGLLKVVGIRLVVQLLMTIKKLNEINNGVTAFIDFTLKVIDDVGISRCHLQMC